MALDFPDQQSVIALADQLDPNLCRLKVGKELFTAQGPAIVDRLSAKGYEIFLDLKFHDIPNTVAKAVGVAAQLGVWMVNVHASGGRRMLEAAANVVAQSQHKPLLVGVTVLTSMAQQDLLDVGISSKPSEQVLKLASLVKESGLDGVVCSAREVEMLRQAINPPFTLVTPGIRPEGGEAADQRRTATPEQAIKSGSDYLVIGRPITESSNPLNVLLQINKKLA